MAILIIGFELKGLVTDGLMQIQHHAQFFVFVIAGADFFKHAIFSGDTHCITFGERTTHHVDDQTLGVMHTEGFVTRRSTEIKDHTGIIRCLPGTHALHDHRICQQRKRQ